MMGISEPLAPESILKPHDGYAQRVDIDEISYDQVANKPVTKVCYT